jgi:hypothetical protein
MGGYDGSNKNTTEEYDGSAWSSGGNLATARGYLAGAGAQLAAFSAGGTTGTNSVVTEEYDLGTMVYGELFTPSQGV